MQDPRHSLPKAPLHEGKDWFNSHMLWLCPQALLFGQLCNGTENWPTWKFASQLICKGSCGNAQLRVPGKAETCTEVTLKLLLNITRAMCLTIPLSKAHWEQESVVAPEILSAISFGDFKFYAVSIKEKTQNFSFMFIFCTKEVLHPKGKLLFEWKKHSLFRTYKSLFIKRHIKGR